jgi:16S rRNA (cytosine1402-N4)-methyltransferase
VDATVGAGGHARALLEAGPEIDLLGLDRDPDALALARPRLAAFGERARLVPANFADLESALEGLPAPDGILADLGVSSMQLESAARGFSFRREGPLDMRMSRSGRSAADVVATASADELARIFFEYGEEWMAVKITRAILEERSRQPITSTRQLARIVAQTKGDREKIDPATRVFQALRIEVNEELQSLSRFLAAAVEKMNAGGRLAVISYHSLEDRMVKEAFRRESGVCLCPPKLPVCVCGARRALNVLTRRPVRPSEAEVRRNPRSRSARLRVAEKVSSERVAL